MRRVRYRAWDKATGVMGSVVAIEFEGNEVCSIIVDIGDEASNFDRDPDEVELMQFTGFEDARGKDIWEGDRIVDTEYSDRTGEVKWCAVSGMWGIKVDGGGWDNNLADEAKYIRVTGNRFTAKK